MTGELLGKLQDWRVFIRIEELFILVPILLNLKGNLGRSLLSKLNEREVSPAASLQR